MDFLHVDLDEDIDRLIQESPLPKEFQYGKKHLPDHSYHPQGLSHRPRLPGQVASSATPRLRVSSNPSHLARFNTFRSTQVLPLASTSLHNESIAEVFNRLKNSSTVEARETSSTGKSLIQNGRGNLSASSSSSKELGHNQRENPPSLRDIRSGFNQSVHRRKAVPTTSYPEADIDHYVAQKVPMQGPVIRESETSFEHHFNLQMSTDGSEDTAQEGDGDTHWRDGQEEVCSLFMWIIKPVPGIAAVRIEGKKSLTDTEFWVSGIVSRRINEKVVETKSGSVYRLEGNMELMDAIVSGFSRSTAEAFWLGFPADWEQLILDHFHCHQHTREPTVEFSPQISQTEEEEICVIETWDTEEVEENQSDNDGKESVDIGLSKGTIDGILDSLDKDITGIETASTSQKTSHVHVEMNKKLPRTSTAIKQCDVNTKKAEKECVLTDWIIKPFPGGGGAHVLGLNQSGIMWNSSAIERRLAKNRLVTVTGGIYKLKGQMDTLLAIQQGLPQKIIAKFKNGFPKEWQELLQEVMTEKTEKKSARTKRPSISTARVKSRTREKVVGETPSDKVRTNRIKSARHTFPRAVPSSPDKKGSLRKPSQSRSSKKEASSVERTGNQNISKRKLPRSTIPDPDKPQNVVLTPNGDFFDLTNLQRSRSGRLVKPPVYWWAGQRICQGEEGYFVKSNTEYADKYCQEFDDQFWSAGKKTTYLKRMKALEDRDNSISSEASIAKKKTITTKTSKRVMSVNTERNDTNPSRRSKSGRVRDRGNENVNCVRTADESLDSTLESAVSDNQSNRLKTTTESVMSEKSDTEINTTLVSDKLEFQEFTFPDIQEEMKVVLKRLRTPQRQTRSLSTPCYNKDSAANVVHSTKVPEDIYTLEDVHTDMKRKQTHKNNAKTIKNLADKEHIEHEQVSIVSSTTGEIDKQLNPSPRRTRSSIGRSCTGNDSLVHKQFDGDVETSRSLRSSKRRSFRKVIVDEESDSCDRDELSESFEVSEVKSKRLSNQRKSSEPQTHGRISNSVSLNKRSLKRRSNEELPDDRGADFLNSSDNNVWTAGDRERLNIACERTATNDPNYWKKIAEVVGTKSSSMCREEFYRTEKEASVKKQKRTQGIERTKVTALTANKGTLKRRQQFSAILNQHNENHSDDLFDSAPFRNTRKGKLSRAEMFEGDDLLGEPSKQNGKSRFETPKGEIDLNEFEKRENVDGYLQRGLHNKGKKKRMVTPKPVKQVKVPEDSPHQKLFREYLEAEQSKSENHMDSDQEQDYYWDQDESTTT